jgi:hypothetical protein
MASRPSAYPKLGDLNALDFSTGKISAALRNYGYGDGVKLPAAQFNELMNEVNQWIQYMDGIDSGFNTRLNALDTVVPVSGTIAVKSYSGDFTVQQTGTIKYYKIGNKISLLLPSMYGISSSPNFFIQKLDETAFPAILLPQTSLTVRSCLVGCNDVGVAVPCSLDVEQGAFFLEIVPMVDGAFTSSGNKGITIATSVDYMID